MLQRWIIVDWDLPHLKLMLCDQAGERLQILATEDLTVPESVQQPGQGRGVAEWLRQQSNRRQIQSGDDKQAVFLGVLLPRDRVTVRTLQVPEIPAEELPAIVPLQMATQLTSRPEDLVVDFLPSSAEMLEAGGKQLTATAIPLPHLADLGHFAAGLNVQLQFVGLSGCALQELLVRLQSRDDAAKSVISSWCSPERIETLHVLSGRLIHSGFRRRNSQQALSSKEPAAEIRRLRSVSSPAGDFQTDHVLLVVEGEAESETVANSLHIASELSQTLCLPVLSLDLDALVAQVSFAEQNGVSSLEEMQQRGMLHLLGGIYAASLPRAEQVNFRAPRQPVPPRDRRKQQLIFAATAIVLVLGTAWWMWSSKLSALQEEIERVQGQLASSEEFIKTKGQIRKQSGNLDSYFERSLDITGHLQMVQETLPKQDQVIVQKWSSTPKSDASHTRVMASGIAKTRQQVETLAEKLDQAGMIVRSPLIRTHEKTEGYPFEFDLDYEIPVEQTPPAGVPSRNSTVRQKSTAATQS